MEYHSSDHPKLEEAKIPERYAKRIKIPTMQLKLKSPQECVICGTVYVTEIDPSGWERLVNANPTASTTSEHQRAEDIVPASSSGTSTFLSTSHLKGKAIARDETPQVSHYRCIFAVHDWYIDIHSSGIILSATVSCDTPYIHRYPQSMQILNPSSNLTQKLSFFGLVFVSPNTTNYEFYSTKSAICQLPFAT